MNPRDIEDNAIQRAFSHLRKLADLQGFVTPAQVEQVAPSVELRGRIEQLLEERDVSINRLVQPRKPRQRETPSRRYLAPGRTPRYADPTWVYLNSVGRVPLLTRAQEIEYSKKIERAQQHLYAMAFSDPESFDTLYLIADKLKRGEVEAHDVLSLEDTETDDTEAIDELKQEFIKMAAQIRRKNGQLTQLGRQLKDTKDRAERALVRERIRERKRAVADLCMHLRLNGRQVQGLLAKFRAFLEHQCDVKQLEEFKHWESERDAAKCSIIEANVRLVVSIAKRHTLRGMEIIDLIQEGNRGLIKAVDNFDYRKGYRFSTYATWWIRQAISRAINDKSKAIRIPANTQDLVNRTLKLCRKWVLEYGYEPTPEEIAKELDCPLSKVQLALEYSLEPISLDMEVGKDGGATFGEYIEDPSAENPADRLSVQGLREQIRTVLESLADKEREIVTMRFGLDDGRVKTLKEIGEIFRISRERVRQIETKALSKLKHPSRTKFLQAWKDDYEETYYEE